MPRVLALYAGRAAELATASGVVRTAIAKSPIHGGVRVDADGFPCDEQISPGHGGPDRAICVYPREHYAHWEAQTGGPLPEPAFGETLTAAGILETETLIGDKGGGFDCAGGSHAVDVAFASNSDAHATSTSIDVKFTALYPRSMRHPPAANPRPAEPAPLYRRSSARGAKNARAPPTYPSSRKSATCSISTRSICAFCSLPA